MLENKKGAAIVETVVELILVAVLVPVGIQQVDSSNLSTAAKALLDVTAIIIAAALIYGILHRAKIKAG